jgi:hypothetical protein
MIESTNPGDIPVACSLSEADLARREQALAETLFANVRSVVALVDGYVFEFPEETVAVDQLVEFIGFERRCCPFFTFELSFAPANGPITLRMRGPVGAKEVIEQMLPSGTTAGHEQKEER